MLLLLKLLTLVHLADAQVAAVPCKEIFESRENIQVYTQWVSSTETCYLSVKAMMTTPPMVYRDFLFDNYGFMMVFNSYGEGNSSQDTGAREFYFFPRALPNPSFAWNDGARRLEVTHTTGEKFYFDYDQSQLIGLSNGQVKTASKVLRTNQGGVEILNYKGLILDGGFSMGQSPSTASGVRPFFKDTNGAVCQVKNTDLYKYPGNGEVVFKFPEDKGLKTFMASKCPKLVF
jgi:hypothetical protein